jgi:hypothetical protein
MIRIARIRTLCAATLLGAALLLPGIQLTQELAPSAAHAAAPSVSMLGTWYNFDHQTRNVTHFSISSLFFGTSIHSYGACVPTDCDWGSAPLTIASGIGTATYHFSFAVVTETVVPSGPFMRLYTQTHFTDNSGRVDSKTLDLYYKPSTLTHWVNVDPNTRNLTRLTLSFDTTGRGALTAFGACTPTDCPWGTQLSGASTPPVPLYFYFNQGFAQKEVVVTGDGPEVQAQTFVRFTDNSGRQNYSVIEHFAYAG